MLAAQAALLEARMQLDLIDGGGHAGLGDDALEVAGWKFETPIDRTSPAARASTNARQVST